MSSQPPTILVIEDEPPIRRFLRVTLPAYGYRLLEAETAHDGLHRLPCTSLIGAARSRCPILTGWR